VERDGDDWEAEEWEAEEREAEVAMEGG